MPGNSPTHKIMVTLRYPSLIVMLHRRQRCNWHRKSVHWFHSKQNLGKWNSLGMYTTMKCKLVSKVGCHSRLHYLSGRKTSVAAIDVGRNMQV